MHHIAQIWVEKFNFSAAEELPSYIPFFLSSMTKDL